uniref:Uncharacterized protein n=1 Tax=Amorphochlora amoebiformis TaxID=1561963 RepID=A0A7S0CRF7_9EUKA|mmetsp:Transcript_12097/g.19195  ORF Transcript_12097/g.19195 Transcript_12097/m.19195 type:complete len:111 (+) Transcript_12097:1-333(+)
MSSAGKDSESGSGGGGPVLALPAPSDYKTTSMTVDQGMKMDKLGPIVINSDGTLSRIANWHKMTKKEQETTYRVLVKRNNHRRAALLKRQQEEKDQQKRKDKEHGTASET